MSSFIIWLSLFSFLFNSFWDLLPPASTNLSIFCLVSFSIWVSISAFSCFLVVKYVSCFLVMSSGVSLFQSSFLVLFGLSFSVFLVD